MNCSGVILIVRHHYSLLNSSFIKVIPITLFILHYFMTVYRVQIKNIVEQFLKDIWLWAFSVT